MATSRNTNKDSDKKTPARKTTRNTSSSRSTTKRAASRTAKSSKEDSDKKTTTRKTTSSSRATPQRPTKRPSGSNDQSRQDTRKVVNSPATARKTSPQNEPSRSNDYKPIIQGNPKAAPQSNIRPVNINRPPVNVVPKQAPTPPKLEAKKETNFAPPDEKISIKLDQSVAILIDGNNIEMSLHSVSKKTSAMINFDKLVPTLLGNRALSRLIYFREGKSISPKLAERLQKLFHGSVVPCHKSADIPLSIKAVQVASKVDTIIILSGDADYVELVRHLKHDGIRVEIAAFPETTADILRQESDYFFPITVDYSFVLK